MHGGTLDDVGPWRDEGLPDGRDGKVSGLVSMLAWLFVSIDGDNKTSSVYVYKDRGYHEVFRGYGSGHRIRGVFVQEGEGVCPRLWIDYNGELIYQDYSLVPLEEDNFEFMHEAALISSTIDSGHADTYKFFKELSAVVANLNRDGRRVEVDYQYDEDVGAPTQWKPVTPLFANLDTTALNIGEIKRMRYRLRMMTDNATKPPVVESVVMKGFEVLPVKRIWSMRIKASSISSEGRSADPSELYNWLWEATKRARLVWMYSVLPELNGILVRLEPPSTLWNFINKFSKWTGVISLTVREM
jgi:hypothetical protein